MKTVASVHASSLQRRSSTFDRHIPHIPSQWTCKKERHSKEALRIVKEELPLLTRLASVSDFMHSLAPVDISEVKKSHRLMCTALIYKTAINPTQSYSPNQLAEMHLAD